MKKIIFVLATVSMFIVSFSEARAENNPVSEINKSKVSESALKLGGKMEIGLFSQYVTTSSLTVFDKPVFQQSLELGVEPWGVYGKVWSSYSPKDGWNSDRGDEMNYLIGLNKGFFDIGYAFCDFHKIGKLEGDMHVFYGSVNFPNSSGIIPFLSMEWNIPTDKDILKGGLSYRAGCYRSLNFSEQPINFEFSISGHNGLYGFCSELISSSRLKISFPFKVWKMTLTPEINFQKRLGSRNGISEDKIWGGVIFSYCF